jgi:SAM-dependent methyltransferase
MRNVSEPWAVTAGSRTRFSIDEPVAGELVSARGFGVAGWVYRRDAAPLSEVRAFVGGVPVGGTRFAYRRPDVNAAIGIPADVPTGFSFHVDQLPLGTTVEVVLEARFDDEIEVLGTLDLRTSAFDVSAEHYGALGEPAFDQVLHRADVYSVGPPSAVAYPQSLDRILAHTSAIDRILDVGCGIGAYAEPLLAAGRSWHGCELVPEYVERIRARGLHVTQASGATLPFADGEFDIAIGIEVLEHIDDVETLVAEIARVVRRGALFSVPNSGAIPRYAPLSVVPWHLLEGSHVNFFNVASFRRLLSGAFAHVEVTEYGELPVPAADGTRVYNHLFAVAMLSDDGPG